MRRSESLKTEWPKLSARTTIPPVLSTATFISATPTWQREYKQGFLIQKQPTHIKLTQNWDLLTIGSLFITIFKWQIIWIFLLQKLLLYKPLSTNLATNYLVAECSNQLQHQKKICQFIKLVEVLSHTPVCTLHEPKVSVDWSLYSYSGMVRQKKCLYNISP
jgi:hypothetical protein